HPSFSLINRRIRRTSARSRQPGLVPENQHSLPGTSACTGESSRFAGNERLYRGISALSRERALVPENQSCFYGTRACTGVQALFLRYKGLYRGTSARPQIQSTIVHGHEQLFTAVNKIRDAVPLCHHGSH